MSKELPKAKSALLAFVSHASEDQVIADRVSTALVTRGVRTWIDDKQLHRRAHEALVSTRIWDALKSATDFVLVATKAALERPWVIHEVQSASERWIATGAPRIWVLAGEDHGHVPDIPFTALMPWHDEGICSLADRIHSSIGGPAPQAIDATTIQLLRSQYLMGGSTAVQAVNTFDGLLPSLVPLIEKMRADRFDGPAAVGLEWLRALAKLLDLRADQAWLCKVLEDATAAPSSVRATLLNNLGTALMYRGLLGEADRYCDGVWEIWRQAGDWPGVAIALGNRALIALEAGNLGSADRWISQAEAALDRAISLGALEDRDSRLEVLTTRGNLNNHRGRYLARSGYMQDAYMAFGDHLALAVALEDRRATAIALGRIAWLDIRGNRASARTGAALDRYLALSISANNPRGAANAHAWRGQQAVLVGNIDDAAREFRSEAVLRDSLSSPTGILRANAWAGLCWRKLREDVEAERCIALALAASASAELDAQDRHLIGLLEGKKDEAATELFLHPALSRLNA